MAEGISINCETIGLLRKLFDDQQREMTVVIKYYDYYDIDVKPNDVIIIIVNVGRETKRIERCKDLLGSRRSNRATVSMLMLMMMMLFYDLRCILST